jgi:hypothetical protein
VANKTEGAHLSTRVLDTVSEATRLGQGEPLLISASHGDGIADVAQELIRCAQVRLTSVPAVNFLSLSTGETSRYFQRGRKDPSTRCVSPSQDHPDGSHGQTKCREVFCLERHTKG